MSIVTCRLSLPANLNRKDTRDFVIQTFLSEQPGTGKGNLCSKYIYIAEQLNNRNILLKRPAVLNKGVDFTVHVEKINFRNKGGSVDMPSHSDIVNDLTVKSNASPSIYNNIKTLIIDLYNCRNVTIQQCTQNPINAGLLTTTEVIMAMKWLFIEQDVTYWNWSGRNMLFSYLQANNLV